MRNRWFHKPELHTGHHHEKKVSWLELFYDLVFVAGIIQLGDALSQQVSQEHAAFGPMVRFAAFFVPMWVAWTGFTFYMNRFNHDDFMHRIMVFLKMFAVGGMAISAPLAMKGYHRVFAFSFACALGIVAWMYLRAWRQEAEAKDYSRYWGIVFAVGSALWFISILVPTPAAYFLWGAGILAILTSPIGKRSRALSDRYPLDMEHLSERYGLLTIIVLGESFVKVLSFLAAQDFIAEPDFLLKGSINLLITCCVWWIYFDDVAGAKLKQGRGVWVTWLYCHIPLSLGVTAVGVGVKKALLFDFAEPSDPAYRLLLSSAVALTFLSVAIIDSVTQRRNTQLSDRTRVNVRYGSAIFIMLVGIVGSSMSAGTFIGIVAAVCVGQVIFDMVMAPLEETEDLHEHTTSTAELSKAFHSGDGAAPKVNRSTIGAAVMKGAPSELKRDLYFFLMEGSWARVCLVFGTAYLIVNLFFAALFQLEPGSITGSQTTFVEAFHFSVQTMSTIGYGAMAPASDYGNALVAIEAAVGLLGVALATGLMLAKTARPVSSVLFSEVMVITELHNKPTLMFRAANARGNEVVEASISVSILKDEISPEGHHSRRVYDLDLVRNRSPIFALSWTVMHVIDETSPLFGVDWEAPEKEIMSVFVTMMGYDVTYAQNTHARHIYTPDEIRDGHRFVDVIHQMDDGRLLLDLDVFHNTIDESAMHSDTEEETDSETEAEAKSEPETETEMETEKETETDTETDSETKTETDSETKTETNSETETKAES